MNAESPVPVENGWRIPPPLAMGLFALCVVFAIILHMLLHAYRKKLTEDKPMPPRVYADEPSPDEDTGSTLIPVPPEHQHIYKPDPHGVPVMSAPPERSINDVHKLRDQDQSIAQLTAQYTNMATCPWKVVEIEAKSLPAISSMLTFYSWALCQMMTPVAVKGSNRGTSAKETLYFLNVGPNVITVVGSDAANALHARINGDYYGNIAARRVEVLKCISESAHPVAPFVPSSFYVVACGQTMVAFLSKAPAEALLADVVEDYNEAVAPELIRTLAEIKVIAAA